MFHTASFPRGSFPVPAGRSRHFSPSFQKMPKNSRSYALAAAAMSAVLLALSPMTASVASAQAAPQANQKKSELETEAEKAFNLANEKKYAEAIQAFNALRNGKFKDWIAQSEDLSSMLDYQIAACLVAQKNWAAAEQDLVRFIEKYPKYSDITAVRLSLVNCYIQQEKWEAARRAVDVILKWLERNPNRGLLVKANVARVDLLVNEAKAKDKAGEKPPEGAESFEKLAQAAGIENLSKLTNNNDWTPEMIEARQKLISLYIKAGRKGEGNALKASVEGHLSGKGGELDPASRIRANMQNLEAGDDYFGQAQDINPDFADEAELAQQTELFRQALKIYQGVMRKDALVKCFAPAIEAAKAKLENEKKRGGETPDEKAQARIDKAEESLEELESYKTAIDQNKDFDALISFRIGACLISLKRSWEAYVAFGDILQNHKDFDLLSTSMYYHILTLRDMGRDDEAQAECKKFIETYKGVPDKSGEIGRVALLLGQISFDRGDYKDAIAQLEWAKQNVGKLPKGYEDVACQIDWFIINAYFARCPWGILTDDEKEYIKGIGKKGYKPKLSKESQKTQALIDAFIKTYQGQGTFAPVVEEMVYRRALLYFYSTMLQETSAAFEEYMDKYPDGYFIPDARYRLAVVQNGIRPPETEDVVRRCTSWIKDYFDVDDKSVLDPHKVPALREDVSANIADSVRSQLPEVYTLLGDANKTLAESVKGSDIRDGIGKKKIVKYTKNDLSRKQKFMDASIDAYILAAKSARDNPDALYFSLTELDKQLPQLENGYEKLLDVYDTLYNWDPDAPDALNYLFKKIDFTVRQARAEASKMERSERQKHIDAAQEKTRRMMAEAILKNINDPRQDGVETLINELAQRLAANVKFHRALKEGEEPPQRDPGEYTAEKAVADLTEMLHLKDTAQTTLIARARGNYAKAIVYDALANPRSADFQRYCAERDRTYRLIANSFEPNELSPTILSMVGTFLLDNGNAQRAEEYFRYALDFYKGAESAEYAFAGYGKILLDRKEYKRAYEIFSEAVDGNIAFMLEPDLRLGRAQALVEMSDADASSLNIPDRFEAAANELNYIKGVKEWRGRPTAAALYYLGLIKEMKAAAERNAEAKAELYKAAVGDYRLCFLTWKKYPEFAAKAMLRTALILRDRLGQPEEAKIQLLQLTDETGRYKNTPEAKEAAKLLQTM